MNILAIGAHPDDIDIYAAGTLLKCVERGDVVKLCVVTSGNIGHYDYSRTELAKIRKKGTNEFCGNSGSRNNVLRYGRTYC